eukprot:6491385-Amphidinium_carterae.1
MSWTKAGFATSGCRSCGTPAEFRRTGTIELMVGSDGQPVTNPHTIKVQKLYSKDTFGDVQ